MSFGSDNHAGAHPRVLQAVVDANAGHAVSYGADPWTKRMEELFAAELGAEAAVFPVFNGTAANVLSFEAATRPWEAVLCARGAHVHVDECGAPERAGRKLLTVDADKLTPDLLDPFIVRIGDEHAIQPRLVSVSNSSEAGEVYSVAELSDLARWAHECGLLLHVDGARLPNAAAALGVTLRELTTDAGVDVLSFGGTKCGALGAEAVVLLDEDLVAGFQFRRKQAMQLASKMRYPAAQLSALLQDGLWRDLAGHANAMAARLADAVADVVEITRPTQANAVFALLPPDVIPALQEAWHFYVWDERTCEVRWMCAWDTSQEDVDAFAADVRRSLGAA